MEHPYPESENILTLVRNIHNGKILLPEFQRNFVWSNQNIKDLLVSILNGYFIGTFLLLRRGGSFDFKIRYFQGVNETNSTLPQDPDERRVEKIVLDGQQRLTAIFYVVFSPRDIPPKGATYPYRYFIRIGEKIQEKDWDDAIWSLSENDRVKNISIDKNGSIQKYSFKELLNEEGGFSNLAKKESFKQYLYENEIIPFSVLIDRSNLDDWLEDYGNYLREKKDEDPNHIKNKKRQMKKTLNNWFDFKVPVLTLENRPLYEVAEVFERINRTGIELSVFALATAVFIKEDHNLRNWWEEYYKNDDQIQNYCKDDDENYPKYILQIMALLQGKEVKKKVLINSHELSVNKEKWDKAAKLLTKALERLENTQTGYGVIKPDLLPYKPIIVTLSGILKYCTSNEQFKKLDSWYWSSVLTGRYGGSSDTAIKQDFDQVKKWFDDDNAKPDSVREAENRIEEIELKKVNQGALYKAILNIIALKGAKDFFTGQSIELIKLNDHHIFPKKSGIQLTNENCILNRTLISDGTNKKIYNKKPSNYLEEIKNVLTNWNNVNDVLKTHLIDDETVKAMKNNDYERFLTLRENTIKNEMRIKITI